MTLELYFHPPAPIEIDSVKITNVVNGEVGYAREAASLVRGDMNQYSSSNPYYADYAQMPPFEPPRATRSWDTQRRHLAETWFARFDDASLPRPMKFRLWDDEQYRHKVIYQTPLYDAVQTDYWAKSDTVFPARLKVKREITHGYDGLPFAFKDPWRVAQSLNAGGPDSAQTILDTYQSQVTPYEPWSDSQSLGVFLDIGPNYPVQYGAQYWKFYAYDKSTDTYSTKDDLPLAEGDLINMDEILFGAGVEVSPSGSIEFLRSSASGVPYREYRLEYKDPLSTMDFTGIYKAHLLSDKEGQPTRSANQRKIDIDPRGVYHLVYESAGEVWYTQSEDGTTWSPEELVSGYSHSATNASLAVLDSSVYVTFMEDDQVMLKRRFKGVWSVHQLLDNYSANNGAATTPVVAAGHHCLDPYGNPKGDVVCVIWDHAQFIEFNLLLLYVDSVFQKWGYIADNSIDQPVFPSIDTDNEFIQFTAAWREGTRIKTRKLQIPSCNPVSFYLAQLPIPDVSFDYEVAVHAPSITHNAASKPVVAYEVKVPSLIYSDRWVNVRTYDETSGSWNTTLYQIPYYQFTRYSDPIAPSIGAHETTTMCGQTPEPGLRLAFHRNWGGGIRVGVIDCQYSEYDQLSAGESFPSVVPFAPNGQLREAFSAPYQVGPFMHAIRTTNDYMSKSMTPGITLVRDLRLRIGDDLALFGVTGLSVRRGSQTVDEVAWYALPDTLVMGVDGEAHELLRSEAFTLSNGNRIEYRHLVYCSDAQAMPTGVSLSWQVRKASDNSVLLSYALPLTTLASDTAMWESWSRVIAQAPSYPVYLSLGVDGSLPSGAELSTAKVWLEDQYIPKGLRDESDQPLPATFVLERNHPNPFNPGTRIPFALGEEGHARLTVHDALGREVARLVDGTLPAGRHVADFDARALPSGTYIARLQFGGRTQSQNMLLVK